MAGRSMFRSECEYLKRRAKKISRDRSDGEAVMKRRTLLLAPSLLDASSRSSVMSRSYQNTQGALFRLTRLPQW